MSSIKDQISDAVPNSAKEFYSRWQWLVPWLVGGLAGLAIGLIIGWAVWPVQWSNARIADLSPSQRAAYVSAVADAYVLDGSGYSEINMYARLDGFGDRIADQVTEAINYYRADPNTDQVQLANLARLATDLGIPVDAAALQLTASLPVPESVGEAAPSAETSGALASNPAASTEEEGSGIWTWLLAILVAGGLIGGGLYLLRYLGKSGQPSESLTEAPPAPMPGESRGPQAVAVSPGPKRASLWKESPPAPTRSPDDLSFDDEEEDDGEEPAVRFGSGDIYDDDDFDEDEDDDPATNVRYGAPQPGMSPAPVGPGSSYNGPSYGSAGNGGAGNGGSAYGSAPYGGGSVSTAPSASAKASFSTAAAATAVAAPVAVATSVAVAEAPRPAPVPVRTAPPWQTQSVIAAPAPSRKIITSYNFQYQSGISDYIEAHNISDPMTGRYIGECGMGVSSKNRALHDNPDQVIALEVWMYDKLDPRDNVNNTRVLLSEYAADRDYAQAFANDPDGSVVTFMAQAGTRFQLEGRNLLLEGEIVSASYDSDGIFTGCKVVMNILKRN